MSQKVVLIHDPGVDLEKKVNKILSDHPEMILDRFEGVPVQRIGGEEIVTAVVLRPCFECDYTSLEFRIAKHLSDTGAKMMSDYMERERVKAKGEEDTEDLTEVAKGQRTQEEKREDLRKAYQPPAVSVVPRTLEGQPLPQPPGDLRTYGKPGPGKTSYVVGHRGMSREAVKRDPNVNLCDACDGSGLIPNSQEERCPHCDGEGIEIK